jgi:hypothetical protein
VQGKPKFSAMVCPASAKLARVPKSIPFATAEAEGEQWNILTGMVG